MQIDIQEYSTFEIAQVLQCLDCEIYKQNRFVNDFLACCRPKLYGKILLSHFLSNLKQQKKCEEIIVSNDGSI
jgi:hypothetical protein